MNTNEKGAIGLSEVICDLTKKGFECFLPIHDYSVVDLIAIKNEMTYRLQVKYREIKEDTIGVSTDSVVNGKRVPININFIDGWAIYCPDLDKVIYVHKSELKNKKSISFRTMPLPNGKECKLYTDFGELAEWPKATVC